jgi:pimeloyl-ACP methyl ester carboxylesterase
VSEHRVASAGVSLAVAAAGDRERPTVLLIHGYPDTKAVWDEVAGELAERFHVVRYDVRGAGGSTAPRRIPDYALDRLIGDLAAVADDVSADRPVHVVGHDWGSTQAWGALLDRRLDGRIASFTSISGPCLDHVHPWVRRRLRRPTARGLRQLAGQLARSWYLLAFAIPGTPQLAWRLAGRRWPGVLMRMEGIPPRPGHPASTLVRDAGNTQRIYRANWRAGLRPRRDPRTAVPVQLIVPTRDRFVSPALHDDLGRFAPDLRRREIRAGHWVIRSHAETVASWIAEFVDEHERAHPALASPPRQTVEAA